MADQRPQKLGPNPPDVKKPAETTRDVMESTWGTAVKLPTVDHNDDPVTEDEPDKTERKSPDKSPSKGRTLGSLLRKTPAGKLIHGAEFLLDEGEQLYAHVTGDDKANDRAPKPYYQQRDEWVEDQIAQIDRYGTKYVLGEHDRRTDRETHRRHLEKSNKRNIHYQMSRRGDAPALKYEWQKRLDAAEATHQKVIDHSYVAATPEEKLQYLVQQHRLTLDDDRKLNRLYSPESALYASQKATQEMHKAGYSKNEIKEALSESDPQMAGWSTKGFLFTKDIAKTYLKEAMADLENLDRRYFLDQERDRIAVWRAEHNIDHSDRRTPEEYDDAITDRLQMAKHLYEQSSPQTLIDRDFEHQAEFMRLLGHEYSVYGDKVRTWHENPQHPHQPASVTQRIACRMYVSGFEREEIHDAIRTFDIKTEGWSEDAAHHYLYHQIDPVLNAAEPDRQQMTLWKQQHGIGHVRRLDVIERVHHLENQALDKNCEQVTSHDLGIDDDLFE